MIATNMMKRQKRSFFIILWWREKMNRASNAACSADMKKDHINGAVLHVGETGDSPNRPIFISSPIKAKFRKE